jgi:hypothetical protein
LALASASVSVSTKVAVSFEGQEAKNMGGRPVEEHAVVAAVTEMQLHPKNLSPKQSDENLRVAP